VHRASFGGEARPGYQQTSPRLRHRHAWGQRGVKSFTGRVYNGRPGLNSRQGIGAQATRSSQLGEEAMIIGIVPCKLSFELHMNGRRVFGAKDKKHGKRSSSD
jgi:hypothetical protein